MLDRMTRQINRGLILVAGIFLIAMILLTCANIFFREMGLPVPGAFELTGFFGAIVASFALGYTQLTRGHIAVDILFRKFPEPVSAFLGGLNNFLCAFFFGAAGWQLVKKGNILMHSGELSETLRMPYYPFVYGAALGCGFLTLVLVMDLLKSLFAGKESAA